MIVSKAILSGKIILFALLSGTICHKVGAQDTLRESVRLFPLERVQLLESPFKHAQETNKKYMLALDADRLLAPFRREAGLPPKSESYANWENSGLDGHIGGHYISALALMYASTGDAQVKERLDYFLGQLKQCQDHLGTGYIGGVPGSEQLWQEIRGGTIQAGNFDLNKKWVPLYNIHKTYSGLRDAYLIAGSGEAKEMLIKMTDWAIRLVQDLSEEQIQDMLRSEHGGLNEVFADVAVITGDERYIRLAKQFTHERFLAPLLKQQDHLTGMHANTQIPKVIGVKRIADVEGNKSWDGAARFFWENVVSKRTVTIGGNSTYEHFHPTDDFSSMINSVEGPETCNTYNMLKLSMQFFQTEADARYVDFYEKGLYNHILSTQHPDHGGLVYFTPMRPGHYRVYSQPHTSFWCCVGSGLENHSKYGEFIYAHQNDDLLVNLFIPSKLDWQEKGVRIEQRTAFPEESKTSLVVNTNEPVRFAMKLRYPSWVKAGELSVAVNGKKQPVQASPGEYITLTRRWKDNDIVTMEFVMRNRVEQLPDGSAYYAFAYGPIVLASKTGTDRLDGLLADDSRGGHIARGPQVPLSEVPMVVGSPEALENLPERISAKELRFALNNVYSTKKLGQQELIPFYQVHDARYVIYWPQAVSTAAADERLKSMDDKFAMLLDSLTVDRVNAGQQQPESDHGVRFENSLTGTEEGIQWREASGWFSYEMKPQQAARFLFVRYMDEAGRDFILEANGEMVGRVETKGRKGLVYEVFELPESQRNMDELTLRVKGNSGKKSAKVVEIRLLKDRIVEGRMTEF